MNTIPLRLAGAILVISLSGACADRLGFEAHQDIGNVAKSGSASLDEGSGVLQISGGGENMWFTNDAFHFVWSRVSGDFSIESGVEWVGSGGNAHRKACLLIREGLEPDAAYVDVAVHGDGLTSLQFREQRGGPTREVQANQKGMPAVGLVRQGSTFYMTIGTAGGPFVAAGPSIRIQFKDPVYVGLGVCAHDNKVLETARFSQTRLAGFAGPAGTNTVLHCALEVVPIGSKDRRVVYHTTQLIEAPNWTQDGKSLVFNSRGRIYRIAAAGGEPELINTGALNKCNNDHGLSPDGKTLAISDQSATGKSLIYLVPSSGGEPKRVSETGPSYWHGWSPDGNELAYCAERGGEYDIYTIPIQGGAERRLTTAKGLDDGPDYSADGKFIYFNSDRSGRMEIWRMRPAGTNQEAVIADEYNNWFPHPSPDGKWLVFLTYDGDVKGHPENKAVRLRLMPLNGGPVQELARLFGGQGTINVPSWSPDSRQVAFVSYELLRK